MAGPMKYKERAISVLSPCSAFVAVHQLASDPWGLPSEMVVTGYGDS